MDWYDEDQKCVQVASYDDDKDLQRDVRSATARGWAVQGIRLSGHLDLQRVTAGMRTGVLVLSGASRCDDKMLVTFVRSAAWAEAQYQEEELSIRAGATKDAVGRLAQLGDKTLGRIRSDRSRWGYEDRFVLRYAVDRRGLRRTPRPNYDQRAEINALRRQLEPADLLE